MLEQAGYMVTVEGDGKQVRPDGRMSTGEGEEARGALNLASFWSRSNEEQVVEEGAPTRSDKTAVFASSCSRGSIPIRGNPCSLARNHSSCLGG